MINKKELKKQYLLTPRRAGIFKIENIKTGKKFIKSAVDLERVYNRHSFQLKQNVHPNREMQKDWNEQGEKNFKFEVIKEIKPKDDPQFDLKKELEAENQKILSSLPGEEKYN